MSDPTPTSPSRITALFERLAGERRAAFIPYITAGDPDLETSFAILCGLAEGGADIIELGVPFSDPMADGEVIQAAMLRALHAGTTLKKVLDLVHRFRALHTTPLVLFGYLNPLFRYGLEAVARDAKEAGVDGMLVVDLPPEEADQLVTPLGRHGLDFIALFTPTSDERRIAAIAARASGFAYYVSMTGVTGDRLSAFFAVEDRVRQVNGVTDLPVAVGFGIQTTDDAKIVSRFARGVVVGTALVRELSGARPEEAQAKARAFAQRFSAALTPVSA